MAIKSSGQLSLGGDIGPEFGVSPGSTISLRGMSSAAGFGTPDAMSEFYGYSAALIQYVSGTTDGPNRGSGIEASPFEITQGSFGDGNATSSVYQWVGRDFAGEFRLTVNTTDQDTTIIMNHRGRRLVVNRQTGPLNIGPFSMRTGDSFSIEVDIQRGREDTYYLRVITIAALGY